jgi:hypothetical protein
MTVRARIDFTLAIMGHIEPRDDDERELAMIFAAQPQPVPSHKRSDKTYEKWLKYQRQYHRDHPRTLAQTMADSERRANRRAIKRFIEEGDKWQHLLRRLSTT